MIAKYLWISTTLSLVLAGCGGDPAETDNEERGVLSRPCPMTGAACVPDCPASGRLPSGSPCQKGSFDNATCTCVLSRPCPMTGAACVPDCPASGKLPSGSPCQKGSFDNATCTCVPVP